METVNCIWISLLNLGWNRSIALSVSGADSVWEEIGKKLRIGWEEAKKRLVKNWEASGKSWETVGKKPRSSWEKVLHKLHKYKYRCINIRKFAWTLNVAMLYLTSQIAKTMHRVFCMADVYIFIKGSEQLSIAAIIIRGSCQ